MSRYLIAAVDLPDAEHIHLTRLPDGSWSAVAMEQVDVWWGTGPRPWADVEEAGA